jgi:hypothetical protein
MEVFTGKSYYVIQKIARLRQQGYRVVKKHVHPDNSVTVTMER